MSANVIPVSINQMAAVYLAVLGVFVGLLLMLTPAFHGGSPNYPVWEVVNWFMMVATPLLLAINWWRKARVGGQPGDPVSREYFAANAAFYTSLGMIIIFWWQFFFGRFPGNEVGLAVNSHVIHYPTMDAVFAILTVHAGIYLWRNAADLQN